MSPASVRRAGAALILVASAALYAMARGGDFYQDDFLFFGQARDARPGWDYLSAGAFGHFLPGLRAAFMGVERTVGLHYDLVIAGHVVLYAASAWTLLRILRLLHGDTPWVLVLVGLFAGSTMWLTATFWWISALQVLPATFLSLVATELHLRHLLSRSWRTAVGAALAFGGALLFYEKPFLLLGLLPLLTLLVGVERDGVRAWLAALAGAWRGWGALGVVAAVYLAAYLSGDFFVETPRPDLRTIAETFATAWLDGFVPAVLGGPLELTRIGALSRAAPPLWLVVLDQLLVVAAVAYTVRRRGAAALRGWILLVVALGANVALIAWTRAGLFGPDVGGEYKYLVDALPFAILGAGLALLPLRAGPRAETAPGPRLPALPLALAVAAWLAVAVPTDVRFANGWADGDNVRFLETFERTAGPAMRGAREPVVLDGAVPETVLASAFQPYNRHSALLALLRDGLRFAGPADRVLVVTADGAVGPGRLEEDVRATAPPACAPAFAGVRSLQVAVRPPLPAGLHYLEVVVETSAPTVLEVPAQATRGNMPLASPLRVTRFGVQPGGSRLLVPVDAGGAAALELRFTGGAEVCVPRAAVGVAAPGRPARG